MRTPSSSALLSVWERAAGQHPVDRALAMLSSACPDRSLDELARLPVGRRDALLIELRAHLVGPHIRGVGRCPDCGERVEYGVHAGDLIDSIGSCDAIGDSDAAHELSYEGCSVRFRLPDSRDLAAIARVDDAARARAVLLERCVLGASSEGRAVAVDRLPARAADAISERMGELDPLCELRIGLSCPACSHAWTVLLDIVPLLWAEWTRLVGRLLQEVHLLARAYAWSEAEILAMSPARRRAYLEMLN